jgi:hypothetical protein
MWSVAPELAIKTEAVMDDADAAVEVEACEGEPMQTVWEGEEGGGEDGK